ncbi:MAG TPA: cytidylate kinase-like family protein [Candidatus Anaerofilum excrementigallinarum]|nr:cytidylate kinase-like family protein [Candidatus Anaerofilum excrementigallinarum]
MRIITISREFGSGGRELGKRLADETGFDYYDSEIIAAVAKGSGLEEGYVENALSNHGWQNFSVSFRTTLHSAARLQAGDVRLLLEQKKVIEQIAALGKDCVIVGRNADVLLESRQPFKLFVCADTQAKLERCQGRAPEGENLSPKELLRKMKQVDRVRAQTRMLLSGSEWGRRDAYHLIVNTTDWNIKDLAPAVGRFALDWFGRRP